MSNTYNPAVRWFARIKTKSLDSFDIPEHKSPLATSIDILETKVFKTDRYEPNSHRAHDAITTSLLRQNEAKSL